MTVLLLSITYIIFISLGLPDTLLGASWPSIKDVLNIPDSFNGILSSIILISTIISSLLYPKIAKHLHTKYIVLISIIMSGISLLGFSYSTSFWMLCIFAIPLGFSGGNIDASINTYAALRFKPKYIGILHSLWAIGATMGPIIMSSFLTSQGYNEGFFVISIIQFSIAFLVFSSLPVWKKYEAVNEAVTINHNEYNTSIRSALKVRGVLIICLTFLVYCGIETTFGLWGTSLLVDIKNISIDTAAIILGTYYGGNAMGRLLSGFLFSKFKLSSIFRTFLTIAFCGLLILFFNLNIIFYYLGFFALGFGISPIYPSLITKIPKVFGNKIAASVISLAGASAMTGSFLFPLLSSVIFDYISLYNLLFIILALLVVLVIILEWIYINIFKINKEEEQE